jgi:hypothetical protein
MAAAKEPAWLIINADDYGYFGGVSRGIIEAATRGIVTATGVFANSSRFEEDAAALRDCDALDTGVHLNLTDGRPLTADMRARVARWGGRFPGKFAIARAVMAGSIGVGDVEREWRTQIERCTAAGLKPRFLNSHEHIHMLPVLFPLARRLAEEFRIPHVRFTTARLARSKGGGALLRGGIIRVLAAVASRRASRPSAHFIGLECSGRIGLDDLDAMTADLRPGHVYELMCHPGRLDPAEVTDRRLLHYHDWEGELAALTDPKARALLEQRGVRRIGYRDIEIRDGRLVAVITGGARHG